MLPLSRNSAPAHVCLAPFELAVSGRLNFAPAPGSSSSEHVDFEFHDPSLALKKELRVHHGFHAAAMSVAFLILVPVGIFVARVRRSVTVMT